VVVNVIIYNPPATSHYVASPDQSVIRSVIGLARSDVRDLSKFSPSPLPRLLVLESEEGTTGVAAYGNKDYERAILTYLH
jgi:hypothetical protein